MNILLISGVSPNISAGLGNSIMKGLIDRGHQVDFITKYKFENMNSNMYSVYDEYEKAKNDNFLINNLKKIYLLLKRKIKKVFFKGELNKGKYIFNFDERETWVDSVLLLSKVSNKYDLILVLFWNHMITAKILQDIFQKLKAPMLLCVADMLPITGGCYYFGKCERFLNSCGLCPAFNSKDPTDYTYHNFKYKKSVYNSINYYYGGNTWLCEYGKQSPIIENRRIKELYLPINEDIFKIKDQKEIRKKLNIDQSKKFILFAGAADIEDERKGFKYLIDAINLFYDNTDIEKRSELLLILAGKIIDENNLAFKMDTIQFGFVGEEILAELYSAADVFLCSSIDDAGPTMINQSIMSGTPVISFDIGIAIDIIVNAETGYKIKIKDSLEFSDRIKKIYELSSENKIQMRNACREIAMEKYSLPAFASRIEAIYNEIQ